MSKYERSRVQTPKGNSSKALMTFQEVNIANSNYSFKIILNNLTRVNFTEKQVSSVSSPFYTTQNPPESNLLIPWGRGRVALLQLEKVVTPLPEIQFYTDDDVILASALRNERRKTIERDKEENFGQTRLGRLRKNLWDLFEYPASSRGAKVLTHCVHSMSVMIMNDVTFFYVTGSRTLT